MKRFEAYLEMRKTFDQDPIKSVRDEILTPTGVDIPVAHKETFLAFFEELEVMAGSGLINDDVV